MPTGWSTFPIDFKGQEITELFLYIIISIGTIISLLFAFALQNITLFLYPRLEVIIDLVIEQFLVQEEWWG